MMKIRDRNEDGSFGEFRKIDPKSKSQDEIIEELQKTNSDLNLQIIDLYEQLVTKGVL